MTKQINYSNFETKKQKNGIKKMFELLKKYKLPKNYKISKEDLICQK